MFVPNEIHKYKTVALLKDNIAQAAFIITQSDEMQFFKSTIQNKITISVFVLHKQL